jgi:D-alanyl-D-alanine carboxypeptidase
MEKITGKPWHHVVAEMLEPLGMPHTTYGDNTLVVKGMTEGYSRQAGHQTRAAYLSATQTHAAGALLSTVDDLFAWGRALHGGKLLLPKTYASMCAPSPPSETYGHGIKISLVRGEVVLGHDGGLNGFQSVHLYLPGPDLSVVVLHNSDDTADLPDTLARQLVAALLGKPYPNAVTVPITEEELQACSGSYRLANDHSTEIVIKVVDGKLLAPDGRALRPIGARVFVLDNALLRVEFEAATTPSASCRLFLTGEGEGLLLERLLVH